MSTTFFENQEIIEIDQPQLEELKRAAAGSPLKRARLCLHHSHDDKVQEMVIAFCRGSYNRPHRHQNKTESFHVIEGELLVVFFDDLGHVTRQLKLAAHGKAAGSFLYRLSSELWHTVIPLSDFVVIHETTTGPFIQGESEIAAWSPAETDVVGIKEFFRGLTN